jgi:hypothetical protein
MALGTINSRMSCIVGGLLLSAVGCGEAGKAIVGDVVSTKVDIAVEQFRKWTPENIQKSPQAYLKFCENQVNLAIEKMDASKIAINQKKATLGGELESQRKKINGGNKSLEELKSKYKAAVDGGTFPIKVGAFEFDQEKAKRTILRVAGEVASAQKLANKLEGAVAKLNSSASDLQSRKDKAKEQLAEIKVQMESLKIQEMTKDLATDLAGMTAALGDIVGVGIDDDDPSATPGLEDLTAGSQVAVNEDEFSAIMAK